MSLRILVPLLLFKMVFENMVSASAKWQMIPHRYRSVPLMMTVEQILPKPEQLMLDGLPGTIWYCKIIIFQDMHGRLARCDRDAALLQNKLS